MIRFVKTAPALILACSLTSSAFISEATKYRPPETPESMRAEADAFHLPKQPDAGKAMVYVVRPSGIGSLVWFNVFLDSHESASEMCYNRGGRGGGGRGPPRRPAD